MSKPALELVRQETKWFQPNRPEVKEFWRQRGQEAKDEGVRSKLVRESSLTTAPKYRLCPCHCGLVLLWSNQGFHPSPEDLEPELTSGEAAPEPQRESEPKPITLPKAVSLAQIAWAQRQLDYLNAGGSVETPREALEALANTSPEGLPYRVADLREPAKRTARLGKAKRTVNKR
jgi:hypothetical protein